MPTYLHLAECCNQEFEDFYSIKADPPTVCPLCKTEGKVKRLVSGGSGRGIVELTGGELKEKVKQDTQEFKKNMYTNENALANFIGEQKYQNNRVAQEKVVREYRNVRPSFRSK